MRDYCHPPKRLVDFKAISLCGRKNRSQVNMHHILVWSWGGGTPPPWLDRQTDPLPIVPKGVFFFPGWKFQSIPELVVHQMFFGQRNIVQQTPEMNDMMILRDNFCTDCGQQGGLTSIPSGTFFDQQKAEVETRIFFVSLKTNHGFLAKAYKDSELKNM